MQVSYTTTKQLCGKTGYNILSGEPTIPRSYKAKPVADSSASAHLPGCHVGKPITLQEERYTPIPDLSRYQNKKHDDEEENVILKWGTERALMAV